MGRKSTTGGVSALGENRIQLYFRFQLQRCRPTLDLKPTQANLAFAKRMVADIEERIRHGKFDLAKEFPTYKGLERFGASVPAGALTVGDYVKLWQDGNTKLSPSTLAGYEKIFRKYWLAWYRDTPIGAVLPSGLGVKIGALTASNKTVNNILACGRVVFDLAVSDKAIADNPAREIDFLDVQGTEPDPYTIEEIDTLLPLLKKRFGDEVADYYEFAFFSGLRPNEQIELQWPDCDLVKWQAKITRGRVENVARETKTYSERTVELHSRAQAVLGRQKARTYLANEHVFLNPNTGRPWIDERSQGRFLRAVVKLSGLRYRVPYQTRHSYATMLLMAGANPGWAAGQLGHSKETFWRIYARWINGGDQGRELAKVEAFTDRGSIPEQGTASPRNGRSTGQFAGQTPRKGRLKAV